MNSPSPPAWSFEVRDPLRFALDVSGVDPTAFCSLGELLAHPVLQGRDAVALGELLRITPSPDGIERWSGHLQQVNGIGVGNHNRQIEIFGSPGHRVGVGMSGGTLRIEGNVGDDLGSGLAGGTIVVTGSAGARAGGFAPGAKLGMRGGIILVGGDTGPETGQKMRRGLIAVRGTAAAGAANLMIAGTLVAGGLQGPFGLGLKRGTIICQTKPAIPAWFGPQVAVEFSFTRILAKFLAAHGPSTWFPFLQATHWSRAQGDRLERNQGELLTLFN